MRTPSAGARAQGQPIPGGSTAVRGPLLAALLPVIACGSAARSAPATATYVVDVPLPHDGELPPDPEHAGTDPSACPADTLAENGVCVRVVASPEIPAWEPPRGHGDPCATWTSGKGLVDCDWKNEDLPDAASR